METLGLLKENRCMRADRTLYRQRKLLVAHSAFDFWHRYLLYVMCVGSDQKVPFPLHSLRLYPH